MPSQFDFVKRSLFFHPVSIRLLPLTFLIPLGLSLFCLHSPSREKTTQLCHSDPPSPSALTADQICADEDVTTCCEGGGCTCTWEGLRKCFEGWAVKNTHCTLVSMCVYLLLEEDQRKPRLINTFKYHATSRIYNLFMNEVSQHAF